MPHVQNELEWNWKGQRVSLKTQLQLALSQRPPSRHSLKLVFCLLFFFVALLWLLLCLVADGGNGASRTNPTTTTTSDCWMGHLARLGGPVQGKRGCGGSRNVCVIGLGLGKVFFSRSLPSAAPAAVQERRAKSESVPREAFPAAWNQNKMSKTERSNRYNKHNRLCFGMCAVCICMCINVLIFWFI